MLDDHDGNPATPDVVVGHGTAAIAAPQPYGLPAGFDLTRAEPVFTGQGSADGVAEAYLRSRFPDYPAPGVTAQRARTRAGRAYVGWTTVGGPDVWEVIAALTPAEIPPDERLNRMAEVFGLRPAQVEGALAYYAEYTEEVDEEIAANLAAAEEAEALWRRQRELLGR